MFLHFGRIARGFYLQSYPQLAIYECVTAQ